MPVIAGQVGDTQEVRENDHEVGINFTECYALKLDVDLDFHDRDLDMTAKFYRFTGSLSRAIAHVCSDR